MVLLLVGLLAVFILGIVMSSHVQLLDKKTMRGRGKGLKVIFEAQQMKEENVNNMKHRVITNDERLVMVSHYYAHKDNTYTTHNSFLPPMILSSKK